MTLTLHKTQVQYSGVIQWWACRPLICLQRQVAKLASGLFYCWSSLCNNSMATNLLMFASSYYSRRFAACDVPFERRHLGRKCSETVTADSGKQGRRRSGALPPWPFIKGVTGQVCLFHNRIIDNFILNQDRIETNFL